jgi:hypothetical protein
MSAAGSAIASASASEHPRANFGARAEMAKQAGAAGVFLDVLLDVLFDVLFGVDFGVDFMGPRMVRRPQDGAMLYRTVTPPLL